MRSTDSRSTATDNPIDGWSDKQLSDAMRQTLKTLRELSSRLHRRGYTVRLDSHAANYIPSSITVTKQVYI